MELFADTTPKTAENFRAFCTDEKGTGKRGKPLHFKGSCFHDLVPKYAWFGGDITHGDGRGGESIYGGPFENEKFVHNHDEGMLAMNTYRWDSNKSQFMILMKKLHFLNGEHVVFGKVVEGLDLMRSIEKDVEAESGIPSKSVVITDCGQIS
ncbi:unnamed protein product [Arabis nemorensis]|uniref:Peptidyl-prolyl cis-trans isomerase n=1 Tax=Arabis nemorensis TaxID=586526 RepID=A0A565C882_9BRAS|nr:unnamed protein product [Arabis nemorensis]VVB09873.1 unnamed protein product [Arabis nemorensis]